MVKIINEDTGVQAKYKITISKKAFELDLKENEAKVIFENQLTVGLNDAYSDYISIRASTDIEQKKGTMYPGDLWTLKGTGGKFGIAMIATKYNISCKLNVYKIDDSKIK